ncbi:MAG: hypothetical protein JO192_01320 [Candidatus Eremiobacteraeota bacterium]|nr:hypothetical protein [Candidatus Eremiobacteraeota bacterium]MBV8331355.1 hypothetical protein [Candidatus Eremiobacteraeota bacterium]MBV8722209.1 hypothetical protein [Candidatus Eremiobacteraeota bacterium]
MRQPRSPVIVEIGWLVYFLATFVLAVYVMVLFVVPRHFNDKIAIALAGLFAAVVMIATRGWFASRAKR